MCGACQQWVLLAETLRHRLLEPQKKIFLNSERHIKFADTQRTSHGPSPWLSSEHMCRHVYRHVYGHLLLGDGVPPPPELETQQSPDCPKTNEPNALHTCADMPSAMPMIADGAALLGADGWYPRFSSSRLSMPSPSVSSACHATPIHTSATRTQARNTQAQQARDDTDDMTRANACTHTCLQGVIDTHACRVY